MRTAHGMKALVLSSHSEPPRVVDVPRPVSTEGSVVATVLAAALNPTDIKRSSRLPSDQLPRVLGLEGVVRVEGRIFYANRSIPPHGTFAQETLVDPTALIPIPHGVRPEQALLAGISGLAAWLAIDVTARMQRGETVVVFGATGAVGQTAVQVAKYLGAGRVVAVGRNMATLTSLLIHGACDAIVDVASATLTHELLEATDGGADLVVDTLFGPALESVLQATRPRGRVVTIGADAGAETSVSFASLLGRSMLTHRNSFVPFEVKSAGFTRLVEAITHGAIGVQTELCALEDLPEYWAGLRPRSGRRIVARLDHT
jgi:NADPH2:quinone reductase